jgi:hypothetical protein
MGTLKEWVEKGEPVHERKIEIRTYAREKDRLVVEGWLRDERLVRGYHWDGGPRPPGVVHWICVRLLLGGWPPTIEDAEAEMPGAPHALCPSVMETVTKVKGLAIAAGFSEAVRKRLGGVEGCAHMMHLIISMGPAALHGYWTQRSRRPHPMPQTLEDLPGLAYVLNSCELWREDGPMVQSIREAMEDGGTESDA